MNSSQTDQIVVVWTTEVIAMRQLRLVFLFAALAAAMTAFAQLPSQVVSRLTKIDGYLVKVEAALEKGRADHNNLDRAKELLKEIQDGYSAHASAEPVLAAARRIEKNEAAVKALEQGKADAKESEKQKEKDKDALAESWAKRLDEYKFDTKEGSKGEYGTRTVDVDRILRTKVHYDAAKALFEEFKATGIDPESHWMLRQSVYDIKVSLDNYTLSIDYIYSEIAENIKQAQTWIAGQKSKTPPLIHGSGRMEDMGDQMRALRKLFPKEEPRLIEMEGIWSKLTADQEALEKIILKNRRMKPDVYKGSEAGTVKSLAAKIVREDTVRRYAENQVKPEMKVLRTHITSPSWDTESAVEWTDTTKSALQYRVSKGLFVQVAAQVGENFFVYTLYVHRDTIGGASGGLTGHVMYRDKFLKENLPK